VGDGVIYLVLWVYGLVVEKASSANFVPVNTAHNWLHFVPGRCHGRRGRRARPGG